MINRLVPPTYDGLSPPPLELLAAFAAEEPGGPVDLYFYYHNTTTTNGLTVNSAIVDNGAWMHLIISHGYLVSFVTKGW